MMLLAAFVAVCAIGFGSSYFLGPDSPLEEKMETVAEEMILIRIDREGENPVYGWLDFSPATPEKKRGYIEND